MIAGTGLRRAVMEDRVFLYESMARSDATAEMMGDPLYPDHPIPDYKEFCDDFDESAFNNSGWFRQYIIMEGDRDIGAICYTVRGNVAELDIWIASRSDWGKGHGTRALRLVAGRLADAGKTDILIMRPSARNLRAISAYEAAGFTIHDPDLITLPEWCLDGGEDYDDAVVMARRV